MHVGANTLGHTQSFYILTFHRLHPLSATAAADKQDFKPLGPTDNHSVYHH